MLLEGLYGKVGGGTVSMQYVFNWIRTSAIIAEVTFPKSLQQLQSTDESVYEYLSNVVKEASASGLNLYHSTGHSLQASACTGVCEPGLEHLVGSRCCGACAALLTDSVLKRRAKRPCNQPGAVASKFSNHKYVTMEQAIHRLRDARQVTVRLFREKMHEQAKRIAAEKKIIKLESKLTAAIKKSNYPKFIRAFQSASEQGLVPDEALQNILTDIAKSLKGKHKWSTSSKSFYKCLLNCGDPWAVKFVSVNLLGMDIRTVQKDRSHSSEEFIHGQVKQNMRRGAEMLKKYGMSGVPCAITEDATSTLLRLDGELKTNAETGEQEVWIEGFDEPIKVTDVEGWEKNLQDVFDARKEDSLARYVYVWTLVPQLPSAPYLPLFMVATNNKFDSRWVWQWWEFIMAEALDNGVNIIGFNSDGDSRLRKCDFQLLLHSQCGRLHILDANGKPHPFMYLSVGSIQGKYVVAGQDYFHVMMRLRRQLLDNKHKLALGHFGLARAAHLEKCPHLHAGDLRYADKQNWPGVCRMFSALTKEWLEKEAEADPRLRPTLAYVEFGFRLLRMATGDSVQVDVAQLPRAEYEALRKQAVVDAAFCLTFAITWRHWLVNHANSGRKPSHIESKYEVSVHFITRETFLDVVVMCQSRILMVKLYREQHATYRIFGDRFSSRFSEYVFQYARMAETNSPSFSVLGFKRHLRHFHLMVDMAVTSGLKLPPSKRGVPNDISRVDVQKYTAPPGWHLSDAEICTILDGVVGVADGVATGDCTKWWMDVLSCPEVAHTNLRSSKEFFSAPVKHFKKADLWNLGVGDAVHVEDAAGGAASREDDDDVIHVPVYDVDEEQDAAAIFGNLVARSGQYNGDGVGDNRSSMEFFREVCDKLKKFNSELIKLAQDRKYRFQVTKMFHGKSKEIDDCDKWDYYSEDDDALIVVKQGSQFKYAIGNVYEIIVLNEVPTNKRNLTAGEALRRGTPRARVPLNFKPDRVVLLMQLYQEADTNGDVLDGYGNANRVHYSLPVQAECAPDYWLSESLLGHVRMKGVDKINGQDVTRMYKEAVLSDRRDLIRAHNE